MAPITEHLQALEAEFAQIVREMEALGARSAAASHYAALCTCRRFLSAPAAVGESARPERKI